VTKPFYYTHRFVSDSSIIEAVYFNSYTNQMFVVLRGKDDVCGYSGVQYDQYLLFKHAESHGRHWNKFVKGKYLGLDGDVYFLAYSEERNVPVNSTAEIAQARPERSFSVTVNFEGDLKFDVHNQEDLSGAVDFVKRLMDKSVVDGIYHVKEVKQIDGS